jgi:hypothetical protein
VNRELRGAALAAALLWSGCAGASPQADAGGPPDVPDEEVITVEAEGEANVIEGNRLATRDAALMSAQRAAVEKAVGVMVSGQMVVSQARLIEDQVFSKTAGYLKSWDILSDQEEDGLRRLKIRARVKLGDVRSDLDSLGLLIRTKKVGNPRLMILIDEKVDGQPSESRTVETELARQLLDKGYKVVDADQLAEIQNQEAVLKALKGDAAQAAELGRRFGAEISIVGTATARRQTGGTGEASEVNPLGDMEMISYRGRLNLKAVKASSGQVVLAESRDAGGLDITSENAAVRCFASMSEAVGEKLALNLAKALFEGAEVQVAVSGVPSFDALQNVMKAVRSADGVRNVVTRSYAGEDAVLDVELAGGNAQTLAASLEGRNKIAPMTIKEVASYRIVAALAAKKEAVR